MMDAQSRLKQAITKDDPEAVKRALAEGAFLYIPDEHPQPLSQALLGRKYKALSAMAEHVLTDAPSFRDMRMLAPKAFSEILLELEKGRNAVNAERDAAMVSIARACVKLGWQQDVAKTLVALNFFGNGPHPIAYDPSNLQLFEAMLATLTPGPFPAVTEGSGAAHELLIHGAKRADWTEALIRRGHDLMARTDGMLIYRKQSCYGETGKLDKTPPPPADYMPPLLQELQAGVDARKHSPAALREWLIDPTGHATEPLLTLAATDMLRPLLALKNWPGREGDCIDLFTGVMSALPAYYRYVYQEECYPGKGYVCARAGLITAEDLRVSHTPRENSVLIAYARNTLPPREVS